MNELKVIWALLLTGLLVTAGCMVTGAGSDKASQTPEPMVEQQMPQPIEYMNAHVQGPIVVVLPGSVKSTSAAFTKRITVEKVADLGEAELTRANFRVLDRTGLGDALNDMTLVVNMGDASALKKLKKGKFKTTKWFAKFDILRAEKMAGAKEGLDDGSVNSIFGSIVGDTQTSETIPPTEISDSIEVEGPWIIGLRLIILDAGTLEQVSAGYFEDQMELGRTEGVTPGTLNPESDGMALESLVHYLVQKAVANLDNKK